jgi:threonine synthase
VQVVGAFFDGCPNCDRTDKPHPLEVSYDYAAWAARDLLSQWRSRPLGVWSYRELLPLGAGLNPISLGEGATPLTRVADDGHARLWVKNETRNPTGAHKDRFHSVGVSMAQFLGFDRTTSGTTGNHGASLAAYAALANMRCLIFCDPASPDVLRHMAQLYGADVVVTRKRHEHLAWLTHERGWFPSTGLTPMPVGNPYGLEGYKSIAYEIFFQLGGNMPAHVVVPVAKGDALYGPWKGFNELQALGHRSQPLPRMHAAQSTGCDPVVQGFAAHADVVPVHPNPKTIALSIGDATAAPLSLSTLYDSGGSAEAVSDHDILAAMRRLARAGIAAEPSGAAAFAAAAQMNARGVFAPDEDVVCIATGAAVKWPAELEMAIMAHELRDDDTTAVRAWIDGRMLS